MTPSSQLRLSLGANLGLLVLVAWLWLGRQHPAPPPSGVSVPSNPTTSAMPMTAPFHEAKADASAPGRGRMTPAIVDQLSQWGLSRSVITSALLEDFHRRWDRRIFEQEKKHAPRRLPDRFYVELTRQRDAEQERELRGALGDAGYLAWDKERILRQVNGGDLRLSAEETDQVYRLQKEFDDQHRELQMAMEDGVADKSDTAKLQDHAMQSLERELVTMFGQQRYNQMRGLSDPVADVQRKYSGLNPSAEQAKAVLQLEEGFRVREAALAKSLTENPGSPSEVAAELHAMRLGTEAQLRAVFGAAAFEDQQRQDDAVFQTLTQYAANWGLAVPEVQSAYQTLRTLHEQTELRRTAAAMAETAGQTVNWRDVNAGIEQERQRTEVLLRNLLGAERVERLKQNGLLTNL